MTIPVNHRIKKALERKWFSLSTAFRSWVLNAFCFGFLHTACGRNGSKFLHTACGRNGSKFLHTACGRNGSKFLHTACGRNGSKFLHTACGRNGSKFLHTACGRNGSKFMENKMIFSDVYILLRVLILKQTILEKGGMTFWQMVQGVHVPSKTENPWLKW